MPRHRQRRSHRTRARRPLVLRPGAIAPLALAGLVAAVLAMPVSPALAGAPSRGPGPRSGQTRPAAHPTGTDPLWGLGVSNSAVDPHALESDMGKAFEAQGEYTPLSGWSYPFGSVLDAKDAGARVYLNINSWHVVGDKKICYPFKNYASGAYNPMLQRWVTELQAFDYDDTFITFTHEPTAHSLSQPSCGTSSQYIAAYDYVYHYFRNHGITYPFIWWMVASSFRNGYAVNWQPPANDFDVVAVDGYNRFESGFWRSPAYIFTAAHDYAASLGKPLLVGEIGTVEDKREPTRKAAWITDAATLFNSWGVAGILWNDVQTYRPDSTAPSLNAWVAASRGGGGAAPFVANASGVPGGEDTTWFSGFTPGEEVDLHLNSGTGPVVGTATADSTGSAHNVNLTFPSPTWGGSHALVAVGDSSGVTAHGTASLSPVEPATFDVAAGDTWTFNGIGFAQGEKVTVTFPGGTPVSKTSDANGSVTIPAVSPAEPAAGGYVQVQSPSFSFQVRFRTDATLTMPDSAEPQLRISVALTGFGASENVGVAVQGGPSLGTLVTSSRGSATSSIVLRTTFGHPVITFTGAKSRVTKQSSISLGATLSLSPATGASGSTVTVTSGPGWVPGEAVHVTVGGTELPDVKADANGDVSTKVVITQHQPGGVLIRLSDDKLGVTANGTFTIT